MMKTSVMEITGPCDRSVFQKKKVVCAGEDLEGCIKKHLKKLSCTLVKVGINPLLFCEYIIHTRGTIFFFFFSFLCCMSQALSSNTWKCCDSHMSLIGTES
jgi:hypothetical protein